LDKGQDVEKCKAAGVTCHVLERRATENYLADHAVKKVKGAKYSALSEFQKLGDAPLGWSKSENWRIAREMNASDLGETDLWKSLEGL